MKINKIISLVFGLAILVSSCTVNIYPENNLPSGEYVRLSLSGGDGTIVTSPVQSQATRATWDDPNGQGKLYFMWETVSLDSDETDKLNLILSDGEKALVNQVLPVKGEPETELKHTGLAVAPNPADAHRADFETVRYYSTDDLNRAKYMCAVAGCADVTEDTDGKQHIFRLGMPSSFIQNESQNPSFLRDYMHMYATAQYGSTNSTLRFNHIPATFRFIITNGTENAMSFNSVSISVVEGGAVASKSADVTFAWEEGNAALSFGAEGYDVLTTELSNINVLKGKKYTAYSMALPLASNEAFAGKVICFTAKCSDGKNMTYLLDGETLANANGANSGIYNWVGGKSYTIRLNIGDGGKTSGTMLSNKDITVATTVGGSFTLKYVDASGNPLANYADICTLDVADMATYAAFIDENVAPSTAEAIAIYDEADVKVGTIAINGIKADNSGLLYSVGMLSDVHLNTQNSYYSDSFTDFDGALKFFNSSAVNVAFTCTCGDISENGIEAEFARFQEIVAANSSTPVYTTTGNHDATQSGINETLWKQYTGHGLTYEVSKTLQNGKTDHYLFLGMSAWNFAEAYTTQNLVWLRSRLEAYKNERCFVITHLFFPDGAGNLLGIYPEGNWLSGVQLNELKALREKYVNSIWFSGHSHWKWALQQFEDKANIYKHQGSGWGVHIPSCAKPSDSDGTPGSSYARQEKKDQSEGAVINVYENHIDILGVDLIAGKYLPIATYRLDTTLEQFEDEPIDETVLTADKFTWYKGIGEMSITDVDGMPGYVDVIFTANGQGYYVKNSTFTEGYDSSNQVFDLDIDYLQCWTGWGTNSQTEVATIDRVGFYSGDYNLVNTVNCYVDAINGVQFQTKSNCDAAFPIKIRMKARGEFYLKDENAEAQGETLTAANFEYNEGKNPGATITDAGGGYIEAIFTDVSQGFWMTNSTFTPGYGTDYQPVDITISGLQCWTGWGTSSQTEVSTIDKVGFYSGSYNLASTDKCYVDPNYGVQFQTSSSCPGPFPIKVRMKVTAYFNLKSNAPSQYISASDFAINPVKVNKNTDIATYVKDVEGMPNYVDVTFTAKSEGYFITHSTHSSNTKKVDVVIEDAMALDANGNVMTIPTYVGFYGYLSSNTASQTYNMGENLSFVNLPADGVAFQTSSSCTGPYPFTVRMKVKTIFYQ